MNLQDLDCALDRFHGEAIAGFEFVEQDGGIVAAVLQIEVVEAWKIGFIHDNFEEGIGEAVG